MVICFEICGSWLFTFYHYWFFDVINLRDMSNAAFFHTIFFNILF